MSSGESPNLNDSNPEAVKADGSEAKLRSAKKRFALPFTADPNDSRLGTRSWLGRLRRDAMSGGFGLAASLVVHAIVLFSLIFVVVQSRNDDDGALLDATWSRERDNAERAAKRRPVSIPIEVASITATTPSEKPAIPNSKTGESPSSVGVRLTDVSGALTSRNQRMRTANLEQLGGSPDSERAIAAGLAWLVRQQTSDGHWELHQGYPDAGKSYIKTDTGATSLALLALLGHGNSHQAGEHRDSVAKGLRWLQRVQDPVTGDLHDQRQEEGRNGSFYAHSMGTIALCEALALTGDAQLRPSAELAVKYLINSQHPDMGGWKYRPLTQRVMAGDLSVTAWALMALHSARMAGIDVATEEFERSSRFLDRVQELGGSRYKYEPNEPVTRVTPARTAIGLLCRQWLGWPKTHPPMVEGVAFLIEDRHRPQWIAGRRNVFEWYYITQVMHNVGGSDWKQWNDAVRNAVIRNQVPIGSMKPGQDIRGSWSPKPDGEGEEYSDKAGRLYITVMCILILETPYRHRAIDAE